MTTVLFSHEFPKEESYTLGRPAVFRLVTPRGTRPIACHTLADAVFQARRRAGVNYVKVEVWKKHYRLRDQYGACIGVVRFRGRDPIAWKYPTIPRAKTTTRPIAVVPALRQYTCTSCGKAFSASPLGRHKEGASYCNTACGRRYMQARWKANLSPERLAAHKAKRAAYERGYAAQLTPAQRTARQLRKNAWRAARRAAL